MIGFRYRRSCKFQSIQSVFFFSETKRLIQHSGSVLSNSIEHWNMNFFIIFDQSKCFYSMWMFLIHGLSYYTPVYKNSVWGHFSSKTCEDDPIMLAATDRVVMCYMQVVRLNTWYRHRVTECNRHVKFLSCTSIILDTFTQF